MKAFVSDPPPKFKPVHLVLETQEEVNLMFHLGQHEVTIPNALGFRLQEKENFKEFLKRIYNELYKFNKLGDN